MHAVAAPAHPSRLAAEVTALVHLARRTATYVPATPRNTTMARPRATMSSSARRPILSPIFNRGIVVILSTMRLLGWRSPFITSALMRMRSSGASVGSVVKAQTVTESVASKRSSWTMTIGRDFPRSPCLPPPSRLRHASLLIPRYGVDERLIIDGVAAGRHRSRLPVRLGRELGRPHVGHPDLDRSQTLGAKSRSVRPHLRAIWFSHPIMLHVTLNPQGFLSAWPPAAPTER